MIAKEEWTEVEAESPEKENKVEFEVDGDSVFYTVKAQNVLEAEESAKKELKKDRNVRDRAYRRGSSTSSWKVKQIENIKDAW